MFEYFEEENAKEKAFPVFCFKEGAEKTERRNMQHARLTAVQ
jgi:hypothetical protein